MHHLNDKQRILLLQGHWTAPIYDPDSDELAQLGYARTAHCDEHDVCEWLTTRAGLAAIQRIRTASEREPAPDGFFMSRADALRIAEQTYAYSHSGSDMQPRLVALEAFRLMITPPVHDDMTAGLHGDAPTILEGLLSRHRSGRGTE